MAVEKQTAIIYLGSKGLLKNVPVKKIREFEINFLDIMESLHKDTLAALKSGKLTDEITSVLEKVGLDLANSYSE